MSEAEHETDPIAEWEAMTGFTDAHEELRDFGRGLKEGGPPPSGPAPLAHAPLIIDTDIGGDPDDAVALAVAALTVPELALVITTDEIMGQRARFARYFLDLLGRQDVPVMAGADLGNTRYFCVDDLTPADVPDQPTNLLQAVESVCTSVRQVRWAGIGPASNLSALAVAQPELVEKLAVTQMGGALSYRDPTRAEHNFRLAPDAARHILQAMKRIALIVSDVTFNPAIEITSESSIYRELGEPDSPTWARVLREHMDRWFADFYPGTMQHDPLTLAAALFWPGVRFGRMKVRLDEFARMVRSDDGIEMKLSTHADYDDFMRWLGERLSSAQPTEPRAAY